MSALLFIQDKRRTLERMEAVNQIRLAMNGSKQDIERAMERWARHAEIEWFPEG